MKERAFYPAFWLCLLLLVSFGCVAANEEPQPGTVAAPLLSPQAGTYSSAIDVAITTTTPDATIRYTTDGSEPTTATGTAYTAPVHVDATLTLRAVAFRTGWTTSAVSTGQYTIEPLVSAPVFSPGPGTFMVAQDVTMTTATAGAEIRYTTDGSTPTPAIGTVYAGAVHIAESLTLRAVAHRAGWTTSIVTSGQYLIGPQAAAPAFAPGPGTYAAPIDVAITTSTPGAAIRYTTDGSTPTDALGTLYTGPVTVAVSLTLKAVAFQPGWRNSTVTSGAYTIGFEVAAPAFDPPPGTYGSAQDVAITTATPGATIRYTVDGTTPTEIAGTVYAAPVHIAETLTLKAVAYRAGWTTSSVTSALFSIEPPEPVFKQFAYAANSESHSISAFEIDPATGTLAQIAGSPFAAGGVHPWSLAVHPSGKFLYVLNYASRDISILSIEASTGALAATSGSPCPAGGAYPSWIALEPAGNYAYVVDSAMNGISAFAVTAATGALTPFGGFPFATGLAPVSIAIHPSGKFAYVANSGSQSLSAFAVDSSTGVLTPLAGSPFSAGGTSPTTAGIDPSGRYIYVTNGASNNISAFAIDIATGALTAVPGSPFAAGGTAPAFIAVDPTGKFAYAANSGSTVSAFAIAAASGALSAVPGSPFTTEGVYPKSIAFEHSGKFVFIANYFSSTVSAFAIDAATGALTSVTGSPFATGGGPYSLATVRIAQ
jgi:6-phosphogluconolactonase